MTVVAPGATAASPGFFFDRAALRTLALGHRAAYASAGPFPHAVIDGFLGESLASALAARFPGPAHPGWLERRYVEQTRLTQLQRRGFEGVDGAVRHLLAELSGMAFLDFLGALTGVDGLIPDPHFRGGGPMLTLPGGHLALHADFNRDRTRRLARKLTALYYLNPAWDPAWGGALELWDAARTRCEAAHAPLLDRLIVMEHGDAHWHGHPAPLACPADRFRAVITAYFYVSTADEPSDAHGAIWASSEAATADDPPDEAGRRPVR